jgi:hypothetical protein
MASDRQIAANQANGRKSRGPKTVAGKIRSSRNARRHGLATVEQGHPQYAPEIEEISKHLCGDSRSADQDLYQAALRFAQSEFLWRCVRAEKVAVVERLWTVRSLALAKGDKGLALGKARAQEAELAYDELVAMDPALPDKGLIQFWLETTVDTEVRVSKNVRSPRPLAELFPEGRSEVDALVEALPDIRRLGRYERRAWSRRKRDFKVYTDMKVQSRLSKGLRGNYAEV